MRGSVRLLMAARKRARTSKSGGAAAAPAAVVERPEDGDALTSDQLDLTPGGLMARLTPRKVSKRPPNFFELARRLPDFGVNQRFTRKLWLRVGFHYTYITLKDIRLKFDESGAVHHTSHAHGLLTYKGRSVDKLPDCRRLECTRVRGEWTLWREDAVLEYRRQLERAGLAAPQFAPESILKEVEALATTPPPES